MITKQNIEVLEQLIDDVSQMVEWVNNNLKSSERAETFKKLVEERRALKRTYRSLKNNPTIAAYGESQKGKSYIISSLLSSPGMPLMVEDERGKKLDFIENFNRQTDNQESTGVVTRFTTDKVSDYKEYPIRINTLSIADLITMLADCYMTAIDSTVTGIGDLELMGKNLVENWSEHPSIQNYLTEDEVGDIKEFLVKNHKKEAGNFGKSGWFDSLALVIRNIPECQWPTIFSPLWSGNKAFTQFLSMAIKSYQEIDFSESVFINTKPVLNDSNDGAETLMSVAVIKDSNKGIRSFYQNNGKTIVPTLICLPNGNNITLDKSMLSIMTAEVVYHVDPETLRNDIEFNFTGIRASGNRTAEENKQYLKNLGLDKPTNRNFLIREKNESYCFDLLDFPGARFVGSEYKDEDIEPTLDEFLLREKVSYLFRKYSDEQRLSILLLCQDEENVSKNLVTPPLRRWIDDNIGKDPIERQNRLRYYGVSPLFLIGTKYNRDLVVESIPGKEFKLDTKVFQRRLKEKMYDELIQPMIHRWFDEWTPGRHFDNTYLLRDYKYSSDVQKKGACNIFRGFPGPETEEHNVDERARIKEVFLNDVEGVRRFFYDPELAWDTTSTIGNDGTYYLIKQITTVTDNAEKARSNTFSENLKKSLDNIYATIENQFHKEGEGEKLEEAIAKGRKFDLAMRSVISQKHEDLFGRFIQFLQMTPNYVSTIFAETVHSPVIINVSELKKYELIIKGVEEAGEHFIKDNEEHNINVLWRVFNVKPGDPLLEGIDLKQLFQQTYKESRSTSYIMAKTLVDKWLQTIQKPEQSLYFTQIGFNQTVLTQFLTNFELMANFVGLRTAIANAISEYVDYTADVKDHRIPLIADVAASIYNAFVMDMGYSLLKDSSLDKVRPKDSQGTEFIKGEEVLKDICSHNEKYNLHLALDYNIVEQENTRDRDVMTQIFKQLESLGDGDGGGQMLKLPSYTNLRRWIEMVKISYIANFKSVDYDEKANEKLGVIINQFNDGRQSASL